MCYMVKDHSDSEKGNPLSHRLLLSINSKGSFICTIPQTCGLHALELAAVVPSTNPIFTWMDEMEVGDMWMVYLLLLYAHIPQPLLHQSWSTDWNEK